MNNEKSRAKKVVLPIALSLAMVAGIIPMNASANGGGEPNDGGLVGTVATPTDTTEGPKLPERIDNITDEEYDRLLVGSVLDAFLEGNEDAQALYDQLSDELKALVDASLEIETGEDMNQNGAVGDAINDGTSLPYADTFDLTDKEEAYYYVLKPGMAVPEGTSHSETENWYFFGKGTINKIESQENTADSAIVGYATSDFNPADLEDGYNADRNNERYQLKEDEEFIPIRLMWGNSPDAEDEVKSVWHVDGIVKKVGNYLVNYHYGLDLDQLKSFEFDVDTTSIIGSNVPDESSYNVPGYKFLGWSTEKNNKDKIVKDIANFEVTGNNDFYAVYEEVVEKDTYLAGVILTKNAERILKDKYGNNFEDVTVWINSEEGGDFTDTHNKTDEYHGHVESYFINGNLLEENLLVDKDTVFNVILNDPQYAETIECKIVDKHLHEGDNYNEYYLVIDIEDGSSQEEKYTVTYHYGMNNGATQSFDEIEDGDAIGSRVPSLEKVQVEGKVFQGWITKKPNGEDQWVDHEDLVNIEVKSDMHFYAYYTDSTPGGGETTEDFRTFNVKHVYGDERVENDTLTVDVNLYKNADGSYRFDEILGLPASKPDGAYLEEANGRYWEGYTIVINYVDMTVDPEEKQFTLTLNKVLLDENGEIVKTIEGATENFDGSIVKYLDNFDKASVDYDGNKYDFISLDYGFADGSLVGTDYVVTATYKKAVEESQDRLFVKHVYPNGDVVIKEPIYNFDSELLKDENYLLTFAKPTEQYVYDNYKVESASPFGWTDYTLTINYKEKAPEQKNINVQVSIDNDAAGTITSGTDFTLTVNEGEKASVTVTWDLNYRYRTDSITINGVEIDLSSSDRSYTFETEDDTVVVVNTYRSSTPVGPTDPDTDPDEEIDDDKTPETGGDEEIDDDPTPEVGGDEEIDDDATPEAGGEEEIEDDATPEAGNKDDVTDTGVASTMPWMVASLVSLGAMVAELIRRKRR